MTISSLSKKVDSVEQQVHDALGRYLADHPNAEILTYRKNAVSIRVRIVDPDFKGMDRVARQEALFKVIETLPDEVQGDITQLLLFTPDETKKSFANFDFEHPQRSQL